jgi:hypothetical protein
MNELKAMQQKLWFLIASAVLLTVIAVVVIALLERGIFSAALLGVFVSMMMSSTALAARNIFVVYYYRRSDTRAVASPPAIAEWLVALIITKRRSESLLGDLEERFHRHVAARGLRRARWLYWAEVLRSILPILWTKARGLGLIAAIAEIWRRAHS